MNQEVIKNILHQWASQYYVQVLLLSCMIFSLVAGLIKSHARRQSKIILFYIVIAILYFTVDVYIFRYIHDVLKKTDFAQKLEESVAVGFTIIEFCTFCHLFATSGRSKKTALFVKVSLTIFAFTIGWFIFEVISGKSVEQITYVSFLISGIEMSILSIYCIIYFYMLLRRSSDLRISAETLVFAALFLYSSIIIPFFLLQEYIYNPLYKYYTILHYFSFSILFLLIGIAFLYNEKKPQM